MSDLNRATFTGFICRDPEIRTLTSGTKVANFAIGVNNRTKNRTTGEWSDEPMFVDINAFDKVAERVEAALRKGSKVWLTGSFRKDEWEKDGKKMSKLKLIMDSFDFVGPGKSSGKRSQDNTTQNTEKTENQGSETKTKIAKTVKTTKTTQENNDETIPF